jgi:hypothetical protein
MCKACTGEMGWKEWAIRFVVVLVLNCVSFVLCMEVDWRLGLAFWLMWVAMAAGSPLEINAQALRARKNKETHP